MIGFDKSSLSFAICFDLVKGEKIRIILIDTPTEPEMMYIYCGKMTQIHQLLTTKKMLKKHTFPHNAEAKRFRKLMLDPEQRKYMIPVTSREQELELFKQSILKNAIAGTKKKK